MLLPMSDQKPERDNELEKGEKLLDSELSDAKCISDSTVTAEHKNTSLPPCQTLHCIADGAQLQKVPPNS